MIKAKEDHIEKLEVIASVILPNVYKQNQNLIQINKQNIEKVKYHLCTMDHGTFQTLFLK